MDEQQACTFLEELAWEYSSRSSRLKSDEAKEIAEKLFSVRDLIINLLQEKKCEC